MEITVVRVSADQAHARAAQLVGGPVRHLCPRCGSSAHGRPLTGRSDLHLSLARHGDDAVVAVGPVAVGVDVATSGSVSAAALAAADLSPSDDPTAAWVAAEAAGKLTGQGLVGPLPPGVVITDVAAFDGLVVAVATWEPVVVRAEGARSPAATDPAPRPDRRP